MALVTELGEALHRQGAAAPRVENAMEALCDRWGLVGNFFCTPTAIFSAFGRGPEQRAYLRRVEPGQLDLGKLADLDQIMSWALRGLVSPQEARVRVRAISSRPAPYGFGIRLMAHVLIGSTAAVLLGGGAAEATVAASISLMLGLYEAASGRVPALERVFVPVVASLASALAAVVAACWPGLDPQVAIVAGVVVLLPGFTLTTAVSELASGHLASGSARMSHAFVTFLLLGFGFSFGGEIVRHLGFVASSEPQVVAAGPAVVVLCLVLSCLGLAVELRVRPADVWVVFVSGGLAFYGARLGTGWLGSALGASVAAFGLGVFSNGYARFLGRPAAVPIVPGILLLVPGAMGFRSVTSFLAADVVAAVGTAFEVALVAIALTGGLLMAGLALPPRRAL